MIFIVSIVIFFVGYILISMEQMTKVSKTSVSLLLGVSLWILALFTHQGHAAVALSETATDIFGLIVFLLSAMTLVEILTHYGLFDVLYERLLRLRIHDKAQFWILTILAFIFSSFLDNLTTTIIFIQIASRFFKGPNLMRTGVAIVIAANAGGAFSPIGDVTTTMLWLAQKFNSLEVFKQVFFPSVSVLIISNLWIGRSIVQNTKDITDKRSIITKSEWIIIALCLVSFTFPLGMTTFHLPPYFGLLLGLGIVWLAVDIFRIRNYRSTKLAMSIEKFFQKTDIASLYFFIGILIAIGALRYLGALDALSSIIFGLSPSHVRIVIGNIIIGGLSAIFDNIPLTAVAIDIVKTDVTAFWTLLAYTVGVGGSLFVIGSAPGIIAMTLLKDLSFGMYIRIGTLPVFVGYIVGILVWYVQFYINGGRL
jgi:Na+/H+ antiporter NhaD/arsenite permease-like protein